MNDTPEAAPVRPSETSAMDRVQTPVERDVVRRPWWRPAAFVGLLVTGVVIAWVLVRGDEAPGSDNLLVHLIMAAEDFRPDVSTTQPAEAEAFVFEQLGWAVPPPDLPGLALVGVSIAPVAQPGTGGGDGLPDVVTPAYRYEGQSGETAFVFAYDYIVLDQVRSFFDLPEATYAVLAEPTPVDARRLDEAYLVTWRRRAIIYTAVTSSETVFEQVSQAIAS